MSSSLIHIAISYNNLFFVVELVRYDYSILAETFYYNLRSLIEKNYPMSFVIYFIIYMEEYKELDKWFCRNFK